MPHARRCKSWQARSSSAPRTSRIVTVTFSVCDTAWAIDGSLSVSVVAGRALEDVAKARRTDDVAWMVRVGLELAPQMTHVGPQIVAIVTIFGAPDLRQQLGVRQHFAGVHRELLQQVELGRGQFDYFVPYRHPSAEQIDRDLATTDHGRGGCWIALLAAPQDCADPGE